MSLGVSFCDGFAMRLIYPATDFIRKRYKIIDKLCTNVKKLLNIAKYIALQGSGCYNAVKRTEQPHIERVFVPQGSRLQYRRFQLRRKGEFDEYAI